MYQAGLLLDQSEYIVREANSKALIDFNVANWTLNLFCFTLFSGIATSDLIRVAPFPRVLYKKGTSQSVFKNTVYLS
jgi:hypothetical protein